MLCCFYLILIFCIFFLLIIHLIFNHKDVLINKEYSLCPILQQEAGVFTPLSSGEGMGVGLFIWLLEDVARRPPSYYSLHG